MPDRPGEQSGRRLDQQEFSPADRPGERTKEHDERQVGAEHAAPHAWACPARDDPWPDHHRSDRPEPEHHERVSKRAVAHAAPSRQGSVLAHRQRAYVAGAPPIEIPRRGVMDGMIVLPAQERRKDEQPKDGAQPGIRAFGWQQRAVRAVVKHDEDANQKTGRRDGKREHEQVRDLQREIHQHRQRQVRQHRSSEVEQAAAEPRPRVRSKNLPPSRLPSPRPRRAWPRGGERRHHIPPCDPPRRCAEAPRVESLRRWPL